MHTAQLPAVGFERTSPEEPGEQIINANFTRLRRRSHEE